MPRGYTNSIPSLLDRSYPIITSLEEDYLDLIHWFNDYLRQTFTLIFETTVPKGRTTEEQILNIAKILFPELRGKYPRSLPSLEKRKLSVDMAIKTVEGYFYIKNFKDKVVKEDDVVSFLRKVHDPFFRIIFVAEKYDKAFLEELNRWRQKEGDMESIRRSYGYDVLIKEKVGYSVLFVS